MAKAEIVDYPVADLPDRYNKARSAIYTQMDKLKIVPTKQGNRAFISDTQLRLLDALNDFLDEDTSHNIDDFLREIKPTKHTQRRIQQTGQLTRQQTGLSSELSFGMVDDVVDISKSISTLRERFELLERASSQGWLLSTSDLATLIGISPATLTKQSEIERWGFTFTKCPVRTGREVSWKVKAPKRK